MQAAQHFTDIDPSTLDTQQQYKLMTGCIVPRPIALVSTIGPPGINAAPYSLFNMVANDPPMIAFSVAKRQDGRPKDTLRNIEALPEFVVHICSERMGHGMQICAQGFEPEVSEVEAAGFELGASLKIAPPRILNAPVQMECRLNQIVLLGRYSLVIGEVVMFHFAEGILNDRFHVDLAALKPIGRASGGNYVRMTDIFEIDLEEAGR
jgi:flavin reductase (DIM6/NTAB) family NADH-FMN oxidoreductase RutF